MKKLNFILLKSRSKASILLLLVLMVSCLESEYSNLVKTEMAKGIVNDSLLFGMRFGETRQEFYDTCWKLNKEGIIMQGPKNNFVKYDLPIKEGDSIKPTITMLFYGIFDKKKIMRGMDMKFYYVAWSLWNKSLQSDKLVPIVKDSLKSWFPGNDFILVPAKKKKGEIHVKVDGNRQIIVEPLEDTKNVNVRIEDLRYKLDKIN